MRCPFCGSEDSQVKDSRPSDENAAIRRRRICSDCGGRFTTFERVQLRELTVVKRSGRKVLFDRDKLSKSISVALRKRPIEPERIDRLVSGLVRQLESSGETEITSAEIGELVMAALRELDPVAYVRFASVYRDFRDARGFPCRSARPRKRHARPSGAGRRLWARSRRGDEPEETLKTMLTPPS